MNIFGVFTVFRSVKSFTFIFNVFNFYGDTPTLTLCIHTLTCVYVVTVNINKNKKFFDSYF